MSLIFLAMAFGGLGTVFGKLWAGQKAATVSTTTGDGSMDFSIATGDDTGLLALLEDI